MEDWSVECLSETTITEVEADSYWCLCRLLEGIQDHYTHAQPGIQRMVFSVRELVRWEITANFMKIAGTHCSNGMQCA